MNIFGDKNKPSGSDPILVNPKGFDVQVPKDRVKELLSKGFKLKWGQVLEEPKPKEDKVAPVWHAEVNKQAILEELEQEEDKLEVEIV